MLSVRSKDHLYQPTRHDERRVSGRRRGTMSRFLSSHTEKKKGGNFADSMQIKGLGAGLIFTPPYEFAIDGGGGGGAIFAQTTRGSLGAHRKFLGGLREVRVQNLRKEGERHVNHLGAATGRSAGGGGTSQLSDSLGREGGSPGTARSAFLRPMSVRSLTLRGAPIPRKLGTG